MVSAHATGLHLSHVYCISLSLSSFFPVCLFTVTIQYRQKCQKKIYIKKLKCIIKDLLTVKRHCCFRSGRSNVLLCEVKATSACGTFFVLLHSSCLSCHLHMPFFIIHICFKSLSFQCVELPCLMGPLCWH